MTKQVSDLLSQALALSEDERTSIAIALLESLDPPADEGVEAAWDREIARRIAELDSEIAKTIPWEEVRARTAEKLR